MFGHPPCYGPDGTLASPLLCAIEHAASNQQPAEEVAPFLFVAAKMDQMDQMDQAPEFECFRPLPVPITLANTVKRGEWGNTWIGRMDHHQKAE